MIANNPKLFEKKLWSELGHGDPLTVVQCKDEEGEAETVTARLLAHKFEHRTLFSDYAVLYRGNHQARIIEQAFRNQKIPYLISGGQSFFDKAEIKDILSWLRLLVNEDDDPAFIRAITTPKRGVGAVTLEKLGAYAGERKISLFAATQEEGLRHRMAEAQRAPLEAFAQFILRYQHRASREAAGPLMVELVAGMGYEAWLFDSEEPRPAESKWKNVQELMRWLGEKGERDGKSLIELTQTIALITMLEGREEGEVDAVRLSTLHASKGLEYGHVFLIGCEEGILPHQESDRQRADRGRAPADVCRHHPRPAQPDHQPLPQAQARWRMAVCRAVTVYQRTGAGRRALHRQTGRGGHHQPRSRPGAVERAESRYGAQQAGAAKRRRRLTQHRP